jgi:DNA polymerase-3 subunit delta'
MGFSDLIGHQRPIKLLQAMLEGGRLPHALLISGPTGVGKRTLAMKLAQAVNCTGNVTDDACGTCRDCGKIERGQHPDVVELMPEGKARKIKVEAVRELRSRIAFKAYEGRYKVFIIREADRMGEEASNALLKTLEEPPPESLLVLTTPEESDLLPTIVSRCLRLPLAPLPRSTVESFVAERMDVSGPVAHLMASMSGGCLGRVLEMDGEKLFDTRRRMLEGIRSLDSRRPGSGLAWAEELASNQDMWPEALRLLRFWYRDLMMLAGPASERPLVNEDLRAELIDEVTGYGPGVFISALDEIDRAEDALDRFIRPELVFENLILALGGLKVKGGHG